MPGKIIKIISEEKAKVDFNGLTRDVNISLVTAEIGNYVVVHAGFAIGVIEEKEAKETYKYLTGK